MTAEPGDWWREQFDEDYYLGYCQLADRAEREAEAIAENLALEPGRRVLDVPCGQGRHQAVLRNRGVRVIGLDLSAYLLDRAAGAHAGPAARGDMRRLPFPDASFDALYNVFTSFGYFSEAENMGVLEEFARVLRPGGRFLLETINRDAVVAAGPPFPRRIWHRGEGRYLLDEIDFEPATSRWVTRRIFARDEGTFRETGFSVRAYTEREMRGLLGEAGFAEIEVGGGLLDDRPYHPIQSWRITYRAIRP